MADFLDEDPDLRTQKYCVISYTLPDTKPDPKGKKRAGYDTPMIKVRGSFSTSEECKARIEVLKKNDKYFHMYVANVGIWGPLLTDKQHEEIGTESEYMNKDMNDFMRDYKSQQDKKEEAFEERKNRLAEKARQDGTKEGQELLASQREHPVSIKDRIFKTQQEIKDLEDRLQEARDLHQKSVALLETYTQEEILAAEEDFKKNSVKND